MVDRVLATPAAARALALESRLPDRLTVRTPAEMEALTGVSVAALTFYDMCKGIDKGMVIKDIRLLRKTGGKSGEWTAEGGYAK